MPTTVARLARLQIFQPTRMPVWAERIISTPYGAGRVTGRLGQIHALMMEAIFFRALRSRRLENGALQLLIDPYAVRATMSAHGRYSAQGLVALAADLRAAVIQVEACGRGLPIVDGLLDRLVPSQATRVHPVTGQARHLWRAEISPTYRAWLDADGVWLHYDPSPLAQLRHGVSQALARLVLTHRDAPAGGWCLDTLLHGVGIDPADHAGMRNRRREVRIDADGLAQIGIIILDNRVDRVPTSRRVTYARPRVAHARGV